MGGESSAGRESLPLAPPLVTIDVLRNGCVDELGPRRFRAHSRRDLVQGLDRIWVDPGINDDLRAPSAFIGAGIVRVLLSHSAGSYHKSLSGVENRKALRVGRVR